MRRLARLGSDYFTRSGHRSVCSLSPGQTGRGVSAISGVFRVAAWLIWKGKFPRHVGGIFAILAARFELSSSR